MSNDLDTLPRRKLTKRQLAELSSFTDPAVILTTLYKYDWTIDKAIQQLVSIASDASKESVQLGAIKYLNQLMVDAMSRAGMIVTARAHGTGPGGEAITFTGSVISNSLKSQKEIDETEIDEIISIQKKEEPNDSIPEENPEEDQEDQEDQEGKEGKEVGEEILTAKPSDVDMHVAKFPEGIHDATGQFDGIAVASSGIPDTLYIL